MITCLVKGDFSSRDGRWSPRMCATEPNRISFVYSPLWHTSHQVKKTRIGQVQYKLCGERLSHVDPIENLIWFDPCCISLADLLYDVLRCPQMSSGHTWEHLCCTFSLSLWGRKQRNCSTVKSGKSRLKHHLCCMYPKMACVRPIGTQCRGFGAVAPMACWHCSGPTAPAMSQMPILIPTLIGNSPLVPVVLHKSIFGRHVMIHDNQEMIENVWMCLFINFDWLQHVKKLLRLEAVLPCQHPRAKRLVVNGCKASSWSRSSEGPADRFQTRDSTKHETRWGLLLYLLYLYLSYLVSHTSSQAIWNDSAVVVL